MLRPRKPLLIVPIRDRRQRRRILTIRNCAIAMLSLAVIFAAISIYNDRRSAPAGEYGRLFGSQVPANAPTPRRVDVVTEAPVNDGRAADPMLTAPAAREQLLLANTNAPAPVAPPVPISAPSAIGNVSAHGTTIVGDGNGVAVVHASTTSTAARPVLSGGIFKQQ
jgi:hypothetical protein